MSKLSKTSKSRYKCCRKPFVLIKLVIIDSLHLFLCISDVLINLLIRDKRIVDGIEKATSVYLNKTTAAIIEAYEQFLNDSCKILFQWFVDRLKKIEMRDLTGPEKV